MTTTEPTTQLGVHLDPARKHDFAFLFDVRDGNPNGDPDAGGMPRIDPETMQGLVTDVAIKRKIRNMVALLGEGKPGYDIYVEAGVALNAQHQRAYLAHGLKKLRQEVQAARSRSAKSPAVDVPDVLRRAHVRSNDGHGKGAVRPGTGAGTTHLLPLDRPGAIPGARPDTHHPDHQEDIDKGESTEMGNKHAIPYGLYLGYGHFSAPLATRTGVSADDLEMLWQAFTLMFEHDRAAGRGEMTIRGLYVFSTRTDSAPPRHRPFSAGSRSPPSPTGRPRSFTDYHIQIDADVLPPG